MSLDKSALDELNRPFQRNRAFRKRYEILSPLVAFDLIIQGLDRGIINESDTVKRQILNDLEKTREGRQLEELFRLTKVSDEMKEKVRPAFEKIVENVVNNGEIDHDQLREFAEDLEDMMTEGHFF